jgi:uncharacterized protein YqjF (DUF2071 family)
MKTIRRPFLTARWSNLAILTYDVPPALLEPHLPAGLELDRRDGAAFASLVAFDFLDTRVWGVPWPGFRQFPEINLRFYVKRGERRGVVFVREFVAKAAVAWLARAIYNEPYLVAPIDSRAADESSAVVTVRRLRWRGRTHVIEVTGSRPAFRPAADSQEHFFKEHQWGFGRDRRNRALAYEIRHPAWDVYPVRSWSVDLDWAQVYGSPWGFLSAEKPVSVVLAAGSAVSVYQRRRLG